MRKVVLLLQMSSGSEPCGTERQRVNLEIQSWEGASQLGKSAGGQAVVSSAPRSTHTWWVLSSLSRQLTLLAYRCYEL